MTDNERETEAKFYVRDLKGIEQRLRSSGARLIQDRVLEVNLRFDDLDGHLERQGRVLRLRQDEKARVTYKDNSAAVGGAVSRREIEFVVDDFEAARDFLGAFGYQVVFAYEKYRTTYEALDVFQNVKGLKSAEIMLDELPYGDFVEIEGDMEQLQPAARELGLDWDKAIQASYHALFKQLTGRKNLEFRDLTFENFRATQITPTDLGVEPADS